MPSRLSSLLVRDGLVGVKRMEKAFQRQVIYGGSLDTILLEMNLVPEERLTQYLALASGLPPASRDEGQAIEPSALALITNEIAAQFRAVPLSIDGEALRVLVCSPLEISELEDLADLLDRALQPLITPEYRWHLVYAKAYRVEAPARFTTLARQLEVDATPIPVGRARSVIIEDPIHAASRPVVDPHATGPLVDPHAAALVPRPPILPTDGRVAATSDDATEKVPAIDHDRARTATLVGVQPNRARDNSHPPYVSRTNTDSGLGQTARAPADVPTRNTPRPSTPPPIEIGFRNPAIAPIGIPRTATVRNVAPPLGVPALPPLTPPSGVPIARSPSTPSSGVPRQVNDGRARMPSMRPRTQSEPISTTGRDSPLAVVRARELLATAEDRDTVFLTLLRATRARARYAGLLTVQGGAAIGRLALAEVGIDINSIQKVLIPLDLQSPFRAVVHNQQPHIGPLQSGDPSIDTMVMRLGGSMPPSAMLMPIVLRDRVVGIVIAHRVHSDLKLVDVTELLPLASAAADALGRLIVRHKSAGYRAPSGEAPKIVLEEDRIDTKKMVRKDAPEWRAPAPTERTSVPEVPTVTAAPPRRISEVLDDIERAKEGTADELIADAVERAADTLGELAKRFPGHLRVERFAVSGRPLRAAQYGGLLELTVRLGAAASELLIDRMSAAQRDVRFYATVCAAELRPRNAVFTLVERLFDQDYGVREIAIEALHGYPVADLTQALVKARRAVSAEDPEMVAAATSAIVQLGDIEAIDEMIDAIERADRGADHVRKALVALTAQDFGLSGKKWRRWYDNASKRHRIEWLIAGLVHKEDSIRAIAINDLRRITGEYFGYHHDLPRKERELAADRWSSWWRETGMRRFVQREDERARPTGILPARRE
jgi:hypothetical protein